MNMEDEVAILLGSLIAIIMCGVTLMYVLENYNTDKINEQLKQEKYELKQKLEKVEQERLNCLISLN